MNWNDFNIFRFRIGKIQRSLQEWIQIGAIFHGSLDTLSMIPGIEKRKLFNLIDSLQIHLGYTFLNDYIIQDSELLSYRIEREIDQAEKEFKKKYGL